MIFHGEDVYHIIDNHQIDHIHLEFIVLDKFRGGRELVPGRELVHHHYIIKTVTNRYDKTFLYILLLL